MSLWTGFLQAVFAIPLVVKKTLGTGYTNPAWKDFADKFQPMALKMEAATGIPWRFALIQAGHESRHGESRLAIEARNLFGFTGDSWYTAGKPVYWIETREVGKDGMAFNIKRPFRKYDSWEESLTDWAGLLERKYPAALAAARAGDFNGFAKGLEAGGYASDRDPKTKELVYAKKLIQLKESLEGIA